MDDTQIFIELKAKWGGRLMVDGSFALFARLLAILQRPEQALKEVDVLKALATPYGWTGEGADQDPDQEATERNT